MREWYDAAAITRARLTALDDAGDSQLISAEGYAGEAVTRVLRAQPHGFTSHPPAGAVGVFARLGESDRLVALGFETTARPRSLPAGAVAIYDADGKVLKFIEAKADMTLAGKDLHVREARKVQVEASEWHWLKAKAVFLGEQGPWFPVMTAGGPSQCVFASVGPARPNPMDGPLS